MAAMAATATWRSAGTWISRPTLRSDRRLVRRAKAGGTSRRSIWRQLICRRVGLAIERSQISGGDDNADAVHAVTHRTVATDAAAGSALGLRRPPWPRVRL